MKRRFLSLVTWIMLFAVPRILQAQDNFSVIDSLQKQLQDKLDTTQAPDLFLHLDKSVYSSGETIWFTGYLLDAHSDIEKQHTLYVVLKDPLNKKVLLTAQFVMELGISRGSLYIPDSIPPGNYELIAYTNTYNGQPNQRYFRAQIDLRSAQKPAFELKISYDSTTQKDSVKLLCRVTTDYGGLASGADFSYQVYDSSRLITNGNKKVNAFGEVLIMVDRKITSSIGLRLVASVRRDERFRQFDVPLVLNQQLVTIQFYPEGGELVAQHTTRIAFEVKHADGSAASVKGSIVSNGQEVAGFQSDVQGQGVFYLLPDATAHYTVQLENTTLQPVYSFPAIQSTGYSLGVQKAVVGDTVKADVQVPETDTVCYLLLHNYKAVFYGAVIKMPEAKRRMIIPVNHCPKGVVTLTLYSQSGSRRAERSILIHDNQRSFVTIEPDSTQYHTRSKIVLKVHVKDEKGKALQSVFSFSTVLSKRIDTAVFKDIVQFNNLEKYLPGGDVVPPLHYSKNQTELLLLTRFWKLSGRQSALPGATRYNLSLRGHLLYKGETVRAPVNMLLIGNAVQNIATDAAGNFEIPNELLRTMADNKIILTLAAGKSMEHYRIVLDTGRQLLNDSLASLYQPIEAVHNDLFPVEEQDSLQKLLQTTTLKAVVVKSQKKQENNDDYWILKDLDLNPCTDYVCFNNVLNCSNHRIGGTKPIEGHTYLVGVSPSTLSFSLSSGNSIAHGQPVGAALLGSTALVLTRITYHGACKENPTEPKSTDYLKVINGTWYAKEFYTPDYTKQNILGTETGTTVYWNHQIKTDSNGDAIISFYTNDLTGKFSCILQGLSDAGPISGRLQYEVVQ